MQIFTREMIVVGLLNKNQFEEKIEHLLNDIFQKKVDLPKKKRKFKKN